MRIKGGLLAPVRHVIERKIGILHDADWHAVNPKWWQLVIHKSLDGGQLSAGGFAILCYFTGYGAWAISGGLAWWIGNKLSLGEIIGAIGGWFGSWNNSLSKKSGWKEGLKRGAFTGSCLAIGLWNPALAIAGLCFPVAAWVGVSIYQFITGKVASSWFIFEIIWGALIGACLPR